MSNVGDRADTQEPVPVSALNQYLYCPRRYWYYRFYDPDDRSATLVDGRTTHAGQSRRADWYREQYYRSQELGLRGQVDLLDESGDRGSPVPVERKRAQSGRYYWNDEVQLAAYCLLVEATHENVDEVDHGIIYLYETDERHRIPITSDHRSAVEETRDAIRRLSPTDPPPIVENRNKCRSCSVRQYCQPETEAHLQSTRSATVADDRRAHQ